MISTTNRIFHLRIEFRIEWMELTHSIPYDGKVEDIKEKSETEREREFILGKFLVLN